MRAEAAGDVGPWRQQAVLGRSHWEADALRDVVRDYALETLAEGDGVLVIDETGFLKQGTASCGVARQYTGSAGKVTNSLMFVVNSPGKQIPFPPFAALEIDPDVPAHRRKRSLSDDG
jgi:SRSO17 transposase